MEDNSLKINEQTLIKRIINWFKKIFKGETEDVVEKSIQKEQEQIKENSKSDFLENLKVETNDRSLHLQMKLENKDIKASDLTHEELEKVVLLYLEQIDSKKEQLKKI